MGKKSRSPSKRYKKSRSPSRSVKKSKKKVGRGKNTPVRKHSVKRGKKSVKRGKKSKSPVRRYRKSRHRSYGPDSPRKRKHDEKSEMQKWLDQVEKQKRAEEQEKEMEAEERYEKLKEKAHTDARLEEYKELIEKNEKDLKTSLQPKGYSMRRKVRVKKPENIEEELGSFSFNRPSKREIDENIDIHNLSAMMERSYMRPSKRSRN